MTPDYTQMMEQLRKGELDSIKITPETFTTFRTAWTNYPHRDEIVGTARREGTIIYHYRSLTNK